MSESRKLMKKAVLAGVGATNNVERIKAALNEAMQDVVKVGQDLLDELEDKGKVKTDNVQSFLKSLQEEATKRTFDATEKVQFSTKKAVKELGLVTRAEMEDVLERLEALEEAAGVHCSDGDGEPKKRGRKKNNNN